MRKKTPITLMIPNELVPELERQASNDLRTRNAYATKIVIQAIEENARKPLKIKEMKRELEANANADTQPQEPSE